MPRNRYKYKYEDYLWSVMQTHPGEPLQLVVQEDKNEDFELVTEIQGHQIFSQAGTGARVGKRFVCFENWALNRDQAVSHPDCPKELKQVLLKEDADHKKCKGKRH